MKARKIMLPDVDVFTGYRAVTGDDGAAVLDARGRPAMQETFQPARVAYSLLDLVSVNPAGGRADDVARMLDLRDDIRAAVRDDKDHVVVSTEAWEACKRRIEAAQFTRNDDVTAAMIRVVREAEAIEAGADQTAASA